ncbi:MAG: carboxylesterase [Acidobacteriota bacterium]|nr:carboxylesterase [Acidobacteriota bacterium]
MTATTPLLETVEQEPDRPARASVIWMHGLGADGHDFASLPLQLGVSPDLAVRYVFPHAPVIPVTLNMGMRMRAWYDIVSLDARGQDETGIRRSAASIEDLIAREVDRGVPSSRIVLAGFSQGAAMALFTGLRHAAPLAGILALSGYLPLHESLPTEASAASQQVEILQAHGQHDDVVPYHLGHGSAELLRAAGYDVEWHEYAMAHQVCPEEVQEIGRWLARVLGGETNVS